MLWVVYLLFQTPRLIKPVIDVAEFENVNWRVLSDNIYACYYIYILNTLLNNE